MTDAVHGGIGGEGESDLSVSDAVAAIDRVRALEEPLRRRAEGVTWVVWGIVTTGFFAVVAALEHTHGPYWFLWMGVAIPAWLGLGVLGAEMVWRIASLTRARLAPDAGKVALALLVLTLLTVGLLAAVYPLSTPSGTAQGLVLLVLPWSLLAAVQWGRSTEVGRRLTIGIAVLVLVLGGAYLLGRDGVAYAGGSALVIGLIMGGVPVAAGTAWTLWGRGSDADVTSVADGDHDEDVEGEDGGEGAGDPDLSVTDAVATIDRVSALDEPLRRRTEGMTWVVWGLVTATFLATQGALGDAVPWQLWLAVWLPAWLGVGVLGAELVWRIASLTRTALAPDARRVGLAFLLGGAALTVLMAAAYPVFPTYLPQIVIAMFLPWAILATVQWGRLTAGGRRVTGVLAVVMVVLGLAVLGGQTDAFETSPFPALIAGLVAGGVPFIAGTWWTLRG